MHDSLITLFKKLTKEMLLNEIDITTDEFFIFIKNLIKTVFELPQNNSVNFELIKCLSIYILLIQDIEKIFYIQEIANKIIDKTSFYEDKKSPEYFIKYKEYNFAFDDLFLKDNSNNIVYI